MENLSVNLTKTYFLKSIENKSNNIKGNIYLISHKTDNIHIDYQAFLVYDVFNSHKKDKLNDPDFDIKIKLFVDLTKEGVYNKCVDWITQNLEGKYEIVENNKNEFQS